MPGHAETADDAEVDFADPRTAALAAPPLDRRPRIRQQVRPVHEHEGPPIDPDVSRIAKMPDQVLDHGDIVLRGMALRDQDFIVLAIPAAGPVLIRPAQAERHSRGPACEHGLDRTLEKSFAAEPVVVVAKTVDPEAPRKLR